MTPDLTAAPCADYPLPKVSPIVRFVRTWRATLVMRWLLVLLRVKASIRRWLGVTAAIEHVRKDIARLDDEATAAVTNVRTDLQRTNDALEHVADLLQRTTRIAVSASDRLTFYERNTGTLGDARKRYNVKLREAMDARLRQRDERLSTETTEEKQEGAA